jgi:hypothetical protein
MPAIEISKTLELIGALVVFFIAYLYLPHLIFKSGVEVNVDLGRRRDTSDLEEFLGSALPSMVLVVMTHLVNQVVVYLALRFSPHVHWGFAIRLLPDWNAIAAFVAGNGREISSYLTTPARRGGEESFLMRLVVVSLVGGMVTGNGTRRWLKQPKFGLRAPVLPVASARRWWSWPQHVWLMTFFLVVEIVSVVPHLVWYWFGNYERINPLMVWTLQKPFVFIRTVPDSRLYFGRFLRYEKTAHGEIDFIVLTNVQRYCYDEIDKCMVEGRSPLRPMGGELTIKWNLVGDVDTVRQQHLEERRRHYRLLRIERLGGELRKAFSGRGSLTVPEIYRLHGGTTSFDVGDYRAAVAWLATRRLIELNPDVDVATVRIADAVSVTFPERITSAASCGCAQHHFPT